MNAWIMPTVWVAGLAVAPHALALQGNLAGSILWWLPAVIPLTAVVHLVNSRSLVDLVEYSGDRSNEVAALSEAIGPYAASVSMATGRLATTASLAPVLLVTAGFAFNETLVYWFPNFGFAFLLLAAVAVVHISGQRTVALFQACMASLAIGGMILLIAVGLWTASGFGSTGPVTAAPSSLNRLLPALLLFVGFDAAINSAASAAGNLRRALPVALMTMTLVLVMWGIVAILQVDADRLAHSYIPHILIAKSAAGQGGRVIMAVVVIASSGAAVNALLAMTARTALQVMDQYVPDRRRFHRLRHPACLSLLGGTAVGLVMAMGMTGTDAIDIFVRAGLYSWLISYGVIHLGRWILIRRSTSPALFRSLTVFAAMALMTLASVILTVTDPDRHALIQFMALSWGSVAILVLGLRLSAKLFFG